MLTPPDLSAESIIACLWRHCGLRVVQVTFLPIGADVRSAAFRVVATDGTAYFLKLRRGPFDAIAADLPTFLHAQGIGRVMAPLPTPAGRLWMEAHGFSWLVYPFFEGSTAFSTPLSPTQWTTLGETMHAVHAAALPDTLQRRLPRVNYSRRYRQTARILLQRARGGMSDVDPIAARMAAFWRDRGDEIAAIVDRAESLAQELQARHLDLVVCHTDLHGNNVLTGSDGALAIVDWDEPILAPKERDLMFIGGGVGGFWNQPEECEWFYQGYGAVPVDQVALAYFRYERIVEDFAAYGEQIFDAQGSIEDRADGLRKFIGGFEPGSVVAMAHRAYQDVSA